MVNYIADNYSREIRVSDIAGYLHISNVYLSKIVKSQFGVSIVQYITSLRMEEARRLLMDTDDLIYIIAEKVGYRDSRHFSKTFRKTLGVSPAAFRKAKHRQQWASGRMPVPIRIQK
jgi:two-component system response regulator YesN